MMTPSIPATFESTTFTEIVVIANPDYKQESGTHFVNNPVDSNLSVEAIPNEKNKYAAELRVKLDSGNTETVPYSFNIVCLTILTVEEIVPEDQRDSYAAMAAHAMAFPAVRELILTLTARQPWGQFSIGLSQLRPNKAEQPSKKPERSPRKPRIKVIK